MENKIRLYVEYQLRFDKRDDIEELKEEIIVNLIDRYNDHLTKGLSEDEAYVSAIKSMGNFTESNDNKVSEEYSIKPSIPDVLLMSGAILSIFGLIITILNTVTGTIITSVSILLFSGSAYYLYSYSQYVRREYMDINKHNLLLTKIFKYIKTSFVFWSISLSLTISSIISNILFPVLVPDLTDLQSDYFMDFIMTYILVFTIALVINLLVFRSIYIRLVDKYFLLTGEKELKGKIKEGYDFLYGDNISLSKKNGILSPKVITVISLILVFIHNALPMTVIERYGNNTEINSTTLLAEIINTIYSSYFLFGVILLLIIITLIFIIIKTLIGKIQSKVPIFVTTSVWFVSSFLYTLIVIPSQNSNSYSYHYNMENTYPVNYAFFIGIIYIIFGIVGILKDRKNRDGE